MLSGKWLVKQKPCATFMFLLSGTNAWLVNIEGELSAPPPSPPLTHTPTNKCCAYGFEMRTQQRDLLIWKSALFWFIPQKINTYKCTHTKFDFLRESCLMFKDWVCIRVSVCVTFSVCNKHACGWKLDKQKVCRVFVLSLSIWANKWVWHIKHSTLMKNA